MVGLYILARYIINNYSIVVVIQDNVLNNFNNNNNKG